MFNIWCTQPACIGALQGSQVIVLPILFLASCMSFSLVQCETDLFFSEIQKDQRHSHVLLEAVLTVFIFV